MDLFSSITEILSLPPTGVIQSLEKLAEQYEANPDSSLTLLETSKTYKLVTKPEFAEILRAYSRAPIIKVCRGQSAGDLVYHRL